MKKRMSAVLALALLLGCVPGAMAQEYVSVAALHDQAQAMGGTWRETFDTPNGEVTVDAPIVVPDVEAMPVITVEKAKLSEELFDRIRQGKKGGSTDTLQYETELNGKLMEFFLGEENYYIYGKQTDFMGYDAVATLWIQHGAYRFSTGKGLAPRARPNTYHKIADVDMDRAYARGTALTVNDIMRLWQEDIDLCLGEGYVIKPTRIKVMGSTLIKNPGNEKVYKRNGYMYVDAEQYIGELPVFDALATQGFSVFHGSTRETNRASERLNPYRIGVDYCGTSLRAYGSTEEDYRTMTELVKTRTVEYEDIPLAPLEDVLSGLTEEIEKGHIRGVESIRLGYILYSNPDMTDYAWAVPRWAVACDYVSDEMKKQEKDMEWLLKDSTTAPTLEDDQVYVYTGEMAPWERWTYMNLPVDAQSGEPIIFTTGDKETFSVPEIVTWEAIQ